MKWRNGILIGLTCLTAGCSFERSGTRHHVIFGFGVVSVPVTNAPVQIFQLRSVGAAFNTAPGARLTVGWGTSLLILVEDGVTNVALEVNSTAHKLNLKTP